MEITILELILKIIYLKMQYAETQTISELSWYL